jgi:hypothetical protein
LTPVANAGETAGRAASGNSVGDLYRSLLEAGRALVVRRRLDIWLEIPLIAAYALLRSTDYGRRPLIAWYVIAGLVALLAPVSGLVLLAAIAPFSESVILTHELGMNPVLLLVVAGSVGLRVAWQVGRTRHAERPPMALILALLLGIGTALGVVHSNETFGSTFGVAQSEMWLAGIGGGLLVLGLAFWAASRGSIRPFIVTIAATTVGGVVSLIEFLDSPLIRSGPIDWMVRGQRFYGRLAGLISSPNGVAAVLIVAAGVLITAALLSRDRRVQTLSALAATPLVAALYLTYSRAALLGLFATAVIAAWRYRRNLGIGLIVVGIAAGALLLPRYLQSRYEAAGTSSTPIAGGLLVASDQQRLTAWGAAARMWGTTPITGHGFGSYGELGPAYGDPELNSPHNEWLRLFAEEGFLVGVIGVAFALSVLTALAKTPGWVAAATLAGAVGYFVAACFNNPFLFFQISVPAYVTIGTGLGLPRAPTAPDVPK